MVEENKLSKFNAGIALAMRIDSLQQVINSARFNPLSFNLETKTRNYQIMVDANDGLLKEAWAKLTKDEKIYGKRIRDLIHGLLEKQPVVTSTKDGDKIHHESYKRLMVLLNMYEEFNKQSLDSHNLNSPNIDDDEGL